MREGSRMHRIMPTRIGLIVDDSCPLLLHDFIDTPGGREAEEFSFRL